MHCELEFKSLHFDISWGCNISCQMCTFHDDKHRNEYVKLEKVLSLSDGLENFKHIHMGDGSEPLINKNWYEIIKYFKSMDKEVSLQTNGKNINNIEVAKKIVMSGLDRISISIDGIDDETISSIRKGITYQEIISAIDLLNQAKKELNCNTPELESNIVAMRKNLNQIEPLVDLLVDKHFLKIRIGFLELRKENKYLINELLLYDKEKIKKIIKSIKNKLKSFNDKVKLDTDTFDFEETDNKRAECRAYYERLYLRQDGNLYACYGKKLLGNVFEIGLDKCLESDDYKEFTKLIETKDNQICSSCRFCRVMTFDDIKSHFSLELINNYGVDVINESIEYAKNNKDISKYWNTYFNKTNL